LKPGYVACAMKKICRSAEPRVATLTQAGIGMPVSDLNREVGISEQRF